MSRFTARILSLIVAVICLTAVGFAQDGSDMKYMSVTELDANFAGRKIHLDFYRRSFTLLRSKRETDVVTIHLNGTSRKFREVRQDDGFNNWFSQQYLEENSDAQTKLRITHFEFVERWPREIIVKAFFLTTDRAGNAVPQSEFKRILRFPIDDIAEVLVQAVDKK